MLACAGREAVRAGASVGRSAHRADCPAVLGPADLPPNSLRSMRSLRSHTGGKHVDDARFARGRQALCASAPHRRASAHRLPPWVMADYLKSSRTISDGPLDAGNCDQVASSGPANHGPRRLGRRLGAPVERRGAQAWSPARVSAPRRPSRRRCLSAANAVSEASSAAGTAGRAPQGSRPAGPAAPPKRPDACRVGARTTSRTTSRTAPCRGSRDRSQARSPADHTKN